MTIDERVRELRLVLPEPFRSPTGAAYPFSWVRVRSNRAYISGPLPLQPNGTLAEPRGKVGESLSIEQGATAARLVGLAMLGSLQRELGQLERLTAWLRVLGMVNVSPGTTQVAAVINGFSELILDVFGRERFGVPVEVEAEVEIAN